MISGRVRNRFQEAGAEERNYSDCNDERKHQRNAKRQRESGKQELADAEQQRNRKKIDDRNQCRREYGKSDFRRAHLSGYRGRLAHFNVTVNILDGNHGVIDHARESQGKTAEDHRIDRRVPTAPEQ